MINVNLLQGFLMLESKIQELIQITIPFFSNLKFIENKVDGEIQLRVNFMLNVK
jgi:hypothetical protein